MINEVILLANAMPVRYGEGECFARLTLIAFPPWADISKPLFIVARLKSSTRLKRVRDERLHVDCAAWSATEVRWGGGGSGYAGKLVGSAPLERVGCLSRPRKSRQRARISRGYRDA